MAAFSCYPTVDGFDGETGIITRTPMGGEDPSWLRHVECWDKTVGLFVDCAGRLEAVPASCSSDSCEPAAIAPAPGLSDFRIRADGSPVLRDIPRLDEYCRYCGRTGLMCDLDGSGFDPSYGTTHSLNGGEGRSALYGRQCIKDKVNGGDTAPNSANWLQLSYTSGPSWRGDLSSGAQLVFDSTNWDTPQTVVVTAREDQVYEPETFHRGQDSYVHHYVVAQDINLQHTFYEDIDVHDLVVSIRCIDSDILV